MLLSHQKFSFPCQILLSLVTISTLTVWSKAPQTQSPFLSGLQSRLEMGCVDRVTFCKRLTAPATPISDPSESFLERCAGYSLPGRKWEPKKHLETFIDANTSSSSLFPALHIRQINVLEVMSNHTQLYLHCVLLVDIHGRKKEVGNSESWQSLSYSSSFFNWSAFTIGRKISSQLCFWTLMHQPHCI